MQVRLFFCAESTAIDAGTNRISAFHLLEEIGAPAFPATMPQMTVVTMLERGAGEPSRAQLQLQVGLENAVSLLINTPLQVDFKDRPATRVLTVLRGMVIPDPVSIRFALNHNGGEIARWTTEVIQTGQSTTTAPTPAPAALPPPPTAPAPVAPAKKPSATAKPRPRARPSGART